MTTSIHSAEAIGILLSQRVSEIAVANGYETDIGLRTYRGKRLIEDDEVPCAVVIEGDDTVTARPGRKPTSQVEQVYALGGYCACSPDHPNDMAHKIIRDLKRAVFGSELVIDRKAFDVKYRGRDIGPRTDGKPIVFAMIEIAVVYVEDHDTP